MNGIYLMKDEKRNYCLFKVGFTSNIDARIKQYTTHNPECECVSIIRTQVKSKRNIEKIFHDEIQKRGYIFTTAVIDGKTTEWFRVSYNDEFFNQLTTKGLTAFQCGKNRKNYGEYRK
jgi:hypothetical protein